MAAVVPGGPARPAELRGSEHSEVQDVTGGSVSRVVVDTAWGGWPDRVGPGGSAEGNGGKEIPEADLGRHEQVHWVPRQRDPTQTELKFPGEPEKEGATQRRQGRGQLETLAPEPGTRGEDDSGSLQTEQLSEWVVQFI